MSERKIRGFIFPADFHERRPYRKLYKRWPYTVDWFTRLCKMAREALNNGRIEAGGEPQTADDLESLHDIDPKWIDEALEHGLLELDDDGCMAIPKWHEYFQDPSAAKSSKDGAKTITDFQEWGVFLRLWHQIHGEEPASSSQLAEIAVEAGIKVVANQEDQFTRARILGRILSTVEGKETWGFTVEQKWSKKNAKLYSLSAKKVLSEDSKSEPTGHKKESFQAAKSYPEKSFREENEENEESEDKIGERGQGVGERGQDRRTRTLNHSIPVLTSTNHYSTNHYSTNQYDPIQSYPHQSSPVGDGANGFSKSSNERRSAIDEAQEITRAVCGGLDEQASKNLAAFMQSPGNPIRTLRQIYAKHETTPEDSRRTYTPQELVEHAAKLHKTRLAQ